MFTWLSKIHPSIVFKWVVYNLCILAIPLIINQIVYIESIKTLENEILVTNQLLLNNIKQSMDATIRNVYIMGIGIISNPKIDLINNTMIESVGDVRRELYDISDELRVYQATTKDVAGIGIYFKSIDRIISSSGVFSSSDFFVKYVEGGEYTYERWIKDITESVDGTFFKSQFKNDMDKLTNMITHVRKHTIKRNGINEATLFVFIDEAAFLKRVKELRLISEGEAMIVEANSNVITSTNSKELDISKINYKLLDEVEGIVKNKINNIDVVITYTASNIYDWKYIFVIPEKVFWVKAGYIRKLINIGLICSIFIGFFAVFLAIRKNYKPIKEIVNILKSKMTKANEYIGNEYDIIISAMNKTFQDRDNYYNRLEKQKGAVRAHILTKLLKGKYIDIHEAMNSLESLGLVFSTEYFAVIMFYVKDYSILFKDDMDIDDDKRYSTTQFIITNVIEELVNKENNGYVFLMDEVMTCLVNFNTEKTDKCKNELVEISKTAIGFIQKNFDIQLSIAISDIHTTLSGIQDAYREAVETVEYKLVRAAEGITSYTDIINACHYAYDFTIEEENQLINCIRAKDYEKAKKIVDDVLNKNIQNEILSYQVIRCLMFDIISTVIKSLYEVHNGNEVYIEQFMPMQRLLSCKDIENMKKVVLSVIYELCYFIKQEDNYDDLIEQVEQFIADNFESYDLNVSAIGEKFNMTSQYLSKIFKDVKGIWILDYINSLRIEKSKQLLENSDLNIEKIAESSGFTNVVTFIRVFKKFEGITPGAYRKIK